MAETDAKEHEHVSKKICDLRIEYLSPENILKESELKKNPYDLFDEWFQAACRCEEIKEANAMCLATATKAGSPSARYVLLKGFDKDGFVFFSNYSSRKGKEMEENPKVAAVFYWEPLKRSVRIEGFATRISGDRSTEYFHSRPKESQIGAFISNQSAVIPNREVLEMELEKLKQIYVNSEVPRPEHWGGYVINPERIEFWQGQSNRLHDRILFRKINDKDISDTELTSSACPGWVIERLSP